MKVSFVSVGLVPGRLLFGSLAMALLSAGCAHRTTGSVSEISARLEPGLSRTVRIPSSRAHRPPARLALDVPVTGPLWLKLTCPTERHTVWLQGILRDPRAPDARFTLEPDLGGAVLKVPRVDAGVPYTLAVINLGPDTVVCDVAFEVVPATDLPRGEVPLDIDQVARGTLFPLPEWAARTFLVAVPERARVAVDVRAEAGHGALDVAWYDDTGLVARDSGRLDLEEVDPGTYRLRVALAPDAPPTTFMVAVSAVPACEPEPVTLHNHRWRAFTLTPEACHRAFLGRIRIDHATPLRLDLEADRPDAIEVRYQAPDQPWVPVQPRSQALPRVTTFGWHRIEVRLNPRLRAAAGVEVRVRMTFHQPCATLTGTVFDVRGDTVIADLHRWQGLRVGMRGYLKDGDRVVGRVEVVGVSSKATVLRVVESGASPQVGFRVVFPCR